MRFLDGPATQIELTRLISNSKSVRMAVAFWGQPVPEILGLLASNRSPEIICNLKMGGTNPDAISALQSAGIDVLQSDHLHGKVYLFDREAIVGSSNASANGLSLQGNEVRGWDEANILVTEESALNAIAEWFNRLPRRKITPTDLEAAEQAWSRRRRVGIPDPLAPNAKLIDDLRKNPSLLNGRRMFVCVYSEDLSPEGEKSRKAAKKQAGLDLADNIDGFEWEELPDFADLICFWDWKNGRFSHEGLWHMPEVREEITKYGTRFQICRRIKKIANYPLSRIGSASDWSPALKLLMEDADDPSGEFMDLGEFSKKYLSN